MNKLKINDIQNIIKKSHNRTTSDGVAANTTPENDAASLDVQSERKET